jgi:octaprenyl-diphosphate synthase
MNLNLKEIQRPVQDLLDETDHMLRERVKSEITLVDKIIHTAPISKGKKIRSTLLFLLSGMNGTFPPHLAEIAASLEMFHLSSLIHDDVVDNSEFRRGEQTLHNNLGNNLSVMWGDYLFISAFNAINKLGIGALMDVTLKAARLMIEGQLVEMENTFNFKAQKDTYYDIIGRKTSSLFAGVTQIASLLNNDSTEVQEEFYRFGMDFGTIFQVSDDMLDIFSDKSGKDRFSDLKEGKITLPYILLLQESKEDKEDIIAELSRKNGEKILAFFQEYNIKQETLKEIEIYFRKATEFINRFPGSVYKDSILNLLEFIRYRDY